MTIFTTWLRFVGRIFLMYLTVGALVGITAILGITAYAFPYLAVALVAGIGLGILLGHIIIVLERRMEKRGTTLSQELTTLVIAFAHPGTPFPRHGNSSTC